MSELQHKGPLDIVREINDVASQCDFNLYNQPSESIESTGQLVQQLMLVEKALPILGQEVIVYGKRLDRVDLGMAEDTELGHLALPEEFSPTRGVYRGLTILNAFSPEFKDSQRRVVHHLERSPEKVSANCFFDTIKQTTNDYVCALGSKIVPVKPINAHSARDLYDDFVAVEFDEIIFDDSDDELSDRVMRLASFLNEAFVTIDYQDELNHQRISYLNSLDVLKGTLALCRDFVLADADEFMSSAECNFSDMSDIIELRPDIFVLAPGYERHAENPGKIIPKKITEIYLEAITKDSKRALIPAKKVIAVY